jgi:hypothetical protein
MVTNTTSKIKTKTNPKIVDLRDYGIKPKLPKSRRNTLGAECLILSIEGKKRVICATFVDTVHIENETYYLLKRK